MKTIIKIIIVLSIVLQIRSYALGDVFQFEFCKSTFYTSHAPVYVDERRIGYTDKYGKIFIEDLSPGTYRVEIKHRDRTWTTSITIDGSEILKHICLD